MKKPAAKPAKGEPSKLKADVAVKIRQWRELVSALNEAKEQELKLRIELVNTFVPKPIEGANTVLGDGFEVKVSQPISRKIDEAALDAVMPQLPEQYRILNQSFSLLNYKPSLSMEAYRLLPVEVRKIFDQALTVKEGTPSLEIVVKEEKVLEKILTRSLTRASKTIHDSIMQAGNQFAKGKAAKVRRKK